MIYIEILFLKVILVATKSTKHAPLHLGMNPDIQATPNCIKIYPIVMYLHFIAAMP